jgi:hypothetical protein
MGGVDAWQQSPHLKLRDFARDTKIRLLFHITNVALPVREFAFSHFLEKDDSQKTTLRRWGRRSFAFSGLEFLEHRKRLAHRMQLSVRRGNLWASGGLNPMID